MTRAWLVLLNLLVMMAPTALFAGRGLVLLWGRWARIPPVWPGVFGIGMKEKGVQP